MKDLKNLLVYGGISVLGIILLIVAYDSGVFPKAAVGYVAIFLVVVLPVIIAVKMAEKERRSKANQ